MGLKVDMIPPSPRSIWEAVKKLQRDLAELRAARTLEAASIGAGGLTITNGGNFRVLTPTGVVELYLGAFTNLPHADGSPQQGMILRREDGSIAFDLFSGSGDPTTQGWNFFDLNSNQLMADDTASRQGLARPYLDASGWFGATEAPAFTTSSATFTTLMTLPWIKQHPKVTAYYLVQASTGATAGEICLVDDFGTQIGPTVVIGLGGFTFGSITGSLAGAHMFPTYLHWQARVTAGAGTLGVKGLSTYGVQS